MPDVRKNAEDAFNREKLGETGMGGEGDRENDQVAWETLGILHHFDTNKYRIVATQVT